MAGMVSDSSHIPVSAHSQLKLHSIDPVELPPRYARTRNHKGEGISDRGASSDVRYRNRSDSFVATNSSIFCSPIKRAGPTGSIHVHRSTKRGLDKSHLQRDTRQALTAEPIAFDPFSDSPYYTWLTQDPNSSVSAQDFRRDANNLRDFRGWVTAKFPKVVATFKALHLLHERPPPSSSVVTAAHTTRERADGPNELEGSDSEDDFNEALQASNANIPHQHDRRRLLLLQREAQQQAWGVLLESARLLSIPPGDTFVTQDVTPARDVFFVLSGQCQTFFQPKFLDLVVQTRNELQSNQSRRKPGSPKGSKRATEASNHNAEIDHVDFQSSLDALLSMRRLSLSTLTDAEASEATAHALYPLRLLSSGDHFGLEACAFRFPNHCISAVSQGALHRNSIGVATQACLHVLVVPFRALEKMRSLILASRTLSPTTTMHERLSPPPDEEFSPLASRRRAHVKRSIQEARAPHTKPATEPLPGCAFREMDVDFLRHTFIMQSIQQTRLQFLAAQLRLIHIPKHEYLFTTGQDVMVYLVKSGQLRVYSPEQVRTHSGEIADRDLRDSGGCSPGSASGGVDCSIAFSTIETRHVELEILQNHDMIGLMEASLLQPTFSNYCLATSADVWVYVIPPVALFTVLAHEPTASHHVVDNLLCHHSWYKARKFTALNHHNKQTEFRLSLGTQRKSPIPCSRCGWSGHTSTSSMCVRAASPKSAFIEHLLGKDESRPPIATQAHTPSLRTRLERVSQMRLAQAHRTGSVALSPTDDPSLSNAGLRTGSLLVGRSGAAIPSNGSVLPGLADLAELIKASQPTEEEAVTPELKSEVAMALDRLDAALEAGELMPPLLSPSRSPRPASQQMQRRRPGDASSSQRGSMYNLREEALRVVARISTASTATPSPRAIMRRKAIDDR